MLALACVGLGSLHPAPADDAASAREYDLKAAYIYNFAKFTEWPRGSFSDAMSPLVIGVVGDDRVAASLTTLTRGRAVNGHPIEVKPLASPSVPPNVRILFVSGSQDAALSKLTGALQTGGLLTVGESEAFTKAGGMIRLLVDSNRLQFEIDNERAEKGGLTLSSQLLMLARKVHKAP
jgi:hypothetical protein